MYSSPVFDDGVVLQTGVTRTISPLFQAEHGGCIQSEHEVGMLLS